MTRLSTRPCWRWLPVLLMLCACGPSRMDPEPSAQALVQHPSFGSNPGGLTMYTYTPSAVPAQAGLVVALHGCTQTAQAFTGTGWNELADLWKFHVIYPQASGGTGCFRWWEPLHTRRGSGEALSIKQMVDRMLALHDIDAQRIFVVGLSAGGAMAASMLAAYPDVFAAGGVIAGLPHGCASSILDTATCTTGGKHLSAQGWGDLVHSAFAGYGGSYPRVSLWHGGSDYTVSPTNQDELLAQWTDVHGIDAVADASATVSGAQHKQYRGQSGDTLVETWRIPNMGHGTPIDPGFQPAGGCGTTGAFTLDANICSTFYLGQFFGLDPLGQQPVPQPPPPDDPAPDDPPPEPDPPPAPPVPTTCTETLASNYHHEQAGRAVRCGAYNFYTCAKGSGETMGLWNTFYQTWLRQTATGHYEIGRCP
jgi:poly(hydroxyalkanoate) depolymerase family esterase